MSNSHRGSRQPEVEGWTEQNSSSSGWERRRNAAAERIECPEKKFGLEVQRWFVPMGCAWKDAVIMYGVN
ncbi:hypothetical protein M0R45_009252 [Rubus argutus]|uniref:Uncharacterized protein n=1 Tax=Rubus argutus TaxID=59490 RepID=A0AAW1Y312_RUBAR